MKKVLIIDDETDLCFLLKVYLNLKHYDVVVANTLVDGLQKINSYHPDILFLDNNLPDGMGWNMACAISDVNPRLKINLMTGQPNIVPQPCDEQFTIIEKPLSYSKIDSSLINQN
ncbi:MAG TPA: response regulator [Cytophaga sp.]|nr:response regulator [Cytophaga sp.]